MEEEKPRTGEVRPVAYNGNGNVNGKNSNISVLGLANLASIGVLILMIAGFWWQTADPSKRIDKMADDQRLYLTKAEHLEFVKRMENSLTLILQKDETLATKEAFKAWQAERDHLIGTIEKRLEDFRGYTVNFYEKFENLPNTYTTRNEFITAQKLNDVIQSRIDRVYGLLDDLSKRITRSNETIIAKDQYKLPQK